MSSIISLGFQIILIFFSYININLEKSILLPKKRHLGFLHIADWCVISLLDLLQFVIVAKLEQFFLNEIHFLHFAHHVPVYAIHNFL